VSKNPFFNIEKNLSTILRNIVYKKDYKNERLENIEVKEIKEKERLQTN